MNARQPSDIDAKLEQLAVDPWCTPGRPANSVGLPPEAPGNIQPTRGAFCACTAIGCCARAASGQVAEEPAITLMKSRRRT